jgi:hypothetical protein
MLSQEEIENHLIALRMSFDPKSPFKGMIDLSDGLLSLPIPDQHQVHDAMSDELKVMVFGKENMDG